MWKKVKSSILLNILLVGAAGFLIFRASFMIREAILVNKEKRAREEEIERLLKKRQQLEEYLREFQEREAVIREAKERLNLKLPGEKVVVVVPDNNSTTSKPQEEITFWEKVKEFLFK